MRGKRKNLPKRKPGSWGKGIGGADEASKKNLKIVKISISDNVLPVCGSSNEYTQHCFFSQSSHESNQSQKSLFGCFTISAYRLSAGRPVSSPQTFFPPVLCHSALLPCTALPCVNKEPDKSLLCPWYDLICGSQLALIVDLSSWKALFWLVTQHFITSLDRPDFRGNDTKANKWFVQYGERCVSSGALFWFDCD